MNKKVITILLLTLTIILVLYGCGNNSEPTIASETTGAIIEATVPGTELPTHPQVEDWIDETTEPLEAETEGTEPEETETEETEPEETETEETEPEETNPENTTPEETTSDKPSNEVTSYEKYMNMSPAEQQAFFESFGSIEAYLAWYDAAVAEYEANTNVTDISGGSVDLGDLMG